MFITIGNQGLSGQKEVSKNKNGYFFTKPEKNADDQNRQIKKVPNLLDKFNTIPE